VGGREVMVRFLNKSGGIRVEVVRKTTWWIGIFVGWNGGGGGGEQTSGISGARPSIYFMEKVMKESGGSECGAYEGEMLMVVRYAVFR